MVRRPGGQPRQMLKEGVERKRGVLRYREGKLSMDKLFAGAPEFLVMSLLMGLVCLISQGQFEESVLP